MSVAVGFRADGVADSVADGGMPHSGGLSSLDV